MTLLIIALVICALIVAAIIAYVGSKTRKRRERKGDGLEKSDVFVNFALALVATFTGVFLAFNLSNMQIERSERENLESLIGQSIDELNVEIASLEGLPEFIKDRGEEDSIKMLNNNPIEDVVSVGFLISNQMFPKYCTQMGTMMMLRLVRDKEKFRKAINNQDLEFENRLLYIDTYREYIEDLRDLLLLERDYVSGEISSKQVAEGLNELHYVDTHDVSLK
jgi:predicted PurR-regulated permease PerM